MMSFLSDYEEHQLRVILDLAMEIFDHSTLDTYGHRALYYSAEPIPVHLNNSNGIHLKQECNQATQSVV